MLGELQRGYTQRNAHTKTHPTETAETEVKKKKNWKQPRKNNTYLRRNNYSNDYKFLIGNHGCQKKVQNIFLSAERNKLPI